MKKNILSALACIAIVLLFTTGSYAASWDAFKEASFSGLFITPEINNGITVYTLSLSEAAQLILPTGTYDIEWIKAVYFVGQTEDTQFIATAGTNSQGWSWDENKGNNKGQISGWKGGGNNELMPGHTMTFSFDDLNFSNGSVIAGFHIGYGPATDWFKGNVPPDENMIPEPSSLLILGTTTLGFLPLIKRKK